MSDSFNIVFRGDVLPGHKLVAVKQKMAALFKADSNTIDALFVGGLKVLKKGLSADAAARYRAALRQAGADVQIVAAQSVAPPKTVVTPDTPSPQIPSPNRDMAGSTAASPESGLQLAPPGTDLISAEPLSTLPPLSAPDFGLRPASGNLVDADELEQLLPVAIAGLEVDLFELGADLLLDDEIEPIAAAIAAPDLALGEAGQDLGQIAEVKEAVSPDISSLSILES